MSKRRSFLVFLIISQCLMDFTILLALNFSIELFNYFNTKLVFTLKCTITQINTTEKSTLSQIHAPHVCFNVRQRFSDDHFFHNVFGQSTHQQLHITYTLSKIDRIPKPLICQFSFAQIPAQILFFECSGKLTFFQQNG